LPLPTSMQAWVSGAGPGREHLELSTLPVPTVDENELLIRVHGAAMNFSDLLMVDDKYQVRPPRPFTPGQEVSGSVVAVGPGSENRLGDEIMAKVLWGGFAEFAIVRADMALPAPASTRLTEAAAIPVSFTTAAVALTEATLLREGETIIIHAAAGAVGLASVQVAKVLKATVIATAGSDEKCDLAKSFGADHAINYRESNFREQALDLTGGAGVDVVLDPVGGDHALESLRSLAWCGRYLIVGFASGRVPKLPSDRLLLKGASAIGVYWNHDVDPEMVHRAERRFLPWLDEGVLRLCVETTYELADLPVALELLDHGVTKGKMVLRVGERPQT